MKFGKIVFAVFALMIALVGAVNAENTNVYTIQQVAVNGITVSQDGDAVYVERGTTVPIEVWVDGNGSEYDARIKAWIGGYEYGDIDATTEPFEVEPGVDYKKVLYLDMPSDMDGSDDYTLHVEIFDDDKEYRQSYTLRVQETRHRLSIMDVIFRPSSTEIGAGKPLFATVRVENMGDNKEENIKVSVKIPELGLETRDYIEELAAYEDRDVNSGEPLGEDNEFEEDSGSSDELYLKIPENVKSGEYEVVVEVEYNRGHDVVKATKTIYVEGSTSAKDDASTVISTNGGERDLVQGEGTEYRVMFANLGKETRIYTIQVVGAGTWADFEVEPSFVSVKAESTGEAVVTVTPNEDAKVGAHKFTIQVLDGEEVVREINLTADVEAKQKSWDVAKTVLGILFVILLAVLIVLVIILAVKAGRKDRSSDDLESTTEEGQTYY